MFSYLTGARKGEPFVSRHDRFVLLDRRDLNAAGWLHAAQPARRSKPARRRTAPSQIKTPVDCAAAVADNRSIDEEMVRKIDLVLDRVKDPESGLSVLQLNLIERFRYNQEKRELYVFADFASHQPVCFTCVGIASIVTDGIRRRLLAELSAEFPELTIMFAEQ